MSKRRRAGTLPSPDATTVSKIRTIISEQFELEILLKRRELYVIQEEIAYGRHLQNLILAASQCEPSSLLLGGTSRFEKSVSASNDETLLAIPDELIDPLGRRTRTASGILPSRDVRDIEKSVFALRDDGIFVRLTCPVCYRYDFINRVGFINHCRNSHKMNYQSVEEWNRVCGVVVEENQISHDDPCRTERVVAHLTRLDHEQTICADSIAHSEIKVFDEAVDADGDTLMDPVSLPTPVKLSTSAASYDLQESDTTANVDSFTSSSLPHSMSAPVDTSSQIISAHQSTSHNPTICASATLTNADVLTDAQQLESRRNRLPMSHFKPLPSIHDQPLHSRFYLKTRVMIGNLSKYIPLDKRGVNSRSTHKWMVYLRTISKTQPPLSTFIKKVVFYIHPSYPVAVHTISHPPFQLKQHGWGEFPVRIQIHFQDDKNQPIDVIHSLSLDSPSSGEVAQCAERCFEIELDRRTELVVDCNDGLVDEAHDAPIDEKLFSFTFKTIEPEADNSLSIPPMLPESNDEGGFGFSGATSQPTTNQSTSPQLSPVFISPTLNVHPPSLTSINPDTAACKVYCQFCGIDGFHAGGVQPCPHRPVTKKGKLKSRLTTLSSFSHISSLTSAVKADDSDVDVISIDQRHSSPVDAWGPESGSALPHSSTTSTPHFNITRELLKFTQNSMSVDAELIANLATKAFLKFLLKQSMTVYNAEVDYDGRQDATSSKKLLVPFHIYRAIFANRAGILDFLTNMYLEAGAV